MVVLTPAYGRKYKTRDALTKDWKDGKDFKIISGAWMGCYCSIRDEKRLRDENNGVIILTDPASGFYFEQKD